MATWVTLPAAPRTSPVHSQSRLLLDRSQIQNEMSFFCYFLHLLYLTQYYLFFKIWNKLHFLCDIIHNHLSSLLPKYLRYKVCTMQSIIYFHIIKFYLSGIIEAQQVFIPSNLSYSQLDCKLFKGTKSSFYLILQSTLYRTKLRAGH